MVEIVDLTKNIKNNLYKEKEIFLWDVTNGLSQTNKQIPSKYFYDEKGSLLFNQITRHLDYYLTRCETEILDGAASHFIDLMARQEFNLIELGPGEGIKTQYFLQPFLQNGTSFTYVPIDISLKYLQNLQDYFELKLPHLDVAAIHAEYLQGLTWLLSHSSKRNLILFLGSSIGNYSLSQAQKFLNDLRQIINHGDYLLVGFDLRKDIRTLLKCYDDDKGITREFNFNLLKRINRELDGNFCIENFSHYATYNVYSGAMESYLISLLDQDVKIGKGHKTYQLKSFEPIHVEYSYKYLPSQIKDLTDSTGFSIMHNFTDKKGYFIDSLWQAIK